MAGELGGCALAVLRNLDASTTFRDVTPALLDLWMAALQGERTATELVQQGALGIVMAILRAPQFRGAAASATLPGAILQLRRAALMAIGSLTINSRFAANTATALGLQREVCFVMSEHLCDPEVLTWGCGSLANLYHATIPPPDMLAPAAAAIASVLLAPVLPSSVVCAAAIAVRSMASTAAGLTIVASTGLRDLVAAAFEKVEANADTLPMWSTLRSEVELTLACIDRLPELLPDGAETECGCALNQSQTLRQPSLRFFVLCHSCGNIPAIVCAACAIRSHSTHVLSSMMFDNVVCDCDQCPELTPAVSEGSPLPTTIPPTAI